MNHDQIKYLKFCLTDYNYKVKELAVEYNLYQSVLNKIKRSIFEEINAARTKLIAKNYGGNKDKFLKTINNLIWINKHALIIKDIASHCNLKLNENYSIYFVRNFIYKSTYFTFKRLKSRPTILILTKLRIAKIFCY